MKWSHKHLPHVLLNDTWW
jgi:propionyl-CoA synthetase